MREVKISKLSEWVGVSPNEQISEKKMTNNGILNECVVGLEMLFNLQAFWDWKTDQTFGMVKLQNTSNNNLIFKTESRNRENAEDISWLFKRKKT